LQITSPRPDHSPKPCDFCDELAGGSGNAFALTYGHVISSRHMIAGGSFCVLPSLGQIVEGHLLLVPQAHLASMAELADGEMGALEVLCKQIRSVLVDMYGQCVFFEHGVRHAGSGGCGIDHAHLHAVPVAGNGILAVLMHNFAGSRIDHFADIRRTIGPAFSYLFFEDSSGERYVFAAPSIPSQYLRKLVCESLGKSDWDWRKSGYEPELVSTLQRLSSVFSTVVTVP